MKLYCILLLPTFIYRDIKQFYDFYPIELYANKRILTKDNV